MSEDFSKADLVLRKAFIEKKLGEMFDNTDSLPLAFSHLGQIDGFDDNKAKKELIEKMAKFGIERDKNLREFQVVSGYRIGYTKMGCLFGIVQTKSLKTPQLDEFVAFTVIKWDDSYQLLEIGHLTGEIVDSKDEGKIASIEFVEIFPKLVEYSQIMETTKNPSEEDRFRKKILRFEKVAPREVFENNGIGQDLIRKYMQYSQQKGAKYVVLLAVQDDKELLDEQGNLIFDKNQRTIVVDKNADVFYGQKLGMIKVKEFGHVGDGTLMYKPLRKVSSSELPSAESLGRIFTACGYDIKDDEVLSRNAALQLNTAIPRSPSQVYRAHQHRRRN